MLLLASKSLQRFLAANVPPPQPDLRSEDWVRIGELAASPDGDPSAEADTLVLQLYGVECDPNLPYPARVAGRGAAPLMLDLHYAISYRSTSQTHVEQALGGVLRAFHTSPKVPQRDFLSADELRRAEGAGETLGALDVALESPAREVTEDLWRGRQAGPRLTLYYRVRPVAVTPFVDADAPRITATRAASPRPLVPGGGGGGV